MILIVVLRVDDILYTICTALSRIAIMSMFFIVFAVHVAFLVTSLCAGIASAEAGIA